MINRRSRMVFGVGVNDSSYVTQQTVMVHDHASGISKQKMIHVCPFYRTWKGMLERCYSKTFHTRSPTYIGCAVTEEWKTFSNFKAWMETQDWGEKQLDKDLLVPGNKVYSADTCVFVDGRVNLFIIERAARRGNFPIGVDWSKSAEKFRSRVRDGNGTHQFLGYFDTKEKAHEAWLNAKLKLAKELAAEIIAEGGDARVAKAIVARYANYNKNSVDTDLVDG